MIFLFLYEAPEQAVRPRTKSEVSVIEKSRRWRKKCLCPTHYTDTSRYFVCGFYDDYLRLISLQLSKGRHFFKATTAERNRKKKKIKKDAEQSWRNWSARCWESRRNRSRNPANLLATFLGCPLQGICFFTFILKIILSFKI